MAAADVPPAAPLAYGQAPPPHELRTLAGERQTLAALHGRPVLVHFFATWCEPCREELAGLSRLAARRKDRPLALLAVDVGEVELRVRRFFDANSVPFPVLLDEDRAAMKAWKVVALPSSFVLDAAGTLRLYASGPVDWDDPAADRLIDALSDPAAPADAGTLPPLNE
ncbi:TlpA family protein disulfide reductase [Starkeya koreensis]|uniref:TlpA family protein disulfide reductase n=1 Tax=Ancylobacter koreensis TaxID=266121 RepID=A0ABT0DHD1_9HYPH|nr:TlpA disulfide reductase family protein [Ancylobacter koreensis]MCK0206599.1 TlpA family protein disulfide reductase [Ancylobacter koreensis]